MVDADGIKIEAGWRLAGINYFAEKNNLFRAKVQGTQVEITVRNDQPDGRKAGDKLTFKPQLFLDGIEQACGNSMLLSVDPVNSNYLENTLEWDYGICRRRLRIIEGSILGSWVFASKPNGEIQIKYNQIGDYKLRLGQFKVNDDEEIVNPTDFDELAQFGGYPVVVCDVATFYPDANPETSSVDGWARRGGVNETWATIRAGAGNIAYDLELYSSLVGFKSSATANQWEMLDRGIYLFDTSALPDNSIISAATLSFYGDVSGDAQSRGVDASIYSSNPASNTAIVAADYTSLGTVQLSNTVLTLGTFSLVGYNDFPLNAAGIAAVSLTSVSKFGSRSKTHDVGGLAPTWGAASIWSFLNPYSAEKGTGYKPKLVVTYTVPVTHEGSATLSGVGTLAGIGRGIFIGKSTLSGTGILATIGRGILIGAAALSGVGSLISVGHGLFSGASALVGIGTLVTNGVRTTVGKIAVSGVGTLTTLAERIRITNGATVLAGIGTLTANAVRTTNGIISLVGTGTLSSIGGIWELVWLTLKNRILSFVLLHRTPLQGTLKSRSLSLTLNKRS